MQWLIAHFTLPIGWNRLVIAESALIQKTQTWYQLTFHSL